MSIKSGKQTGEQTGSSKTINFSRTSSEYDKKIIIPFVNFSQCFGEAMADG